ncbi:putative Na(+)/H(+) antiporter C3A11.09 [Trichinella pseudospiralis]
MMEYGREQRRGRWLVCAVLVPEWSSGCVIQSGQISSSKRIGCRNMQSVDDVWLCCALSRCVVGSIRMVGQCDDLRWTACGGKLTSLNSYNGQKQLEDRCERAGPVGESKFSEQ